MMFEGLKREFAISIDVYLEYCEEAASKPSKTRTARGVPLRKAAPAYGRDPAWAASEQAARNSGLSLDCWVAQALEHSLAAETPAPGV